MHHSVETTRFLVNLIDSSPLAMVVTHWTTNSSPAGTASSQFHIQDGRQLYPQYLSFIFYLSRWYRFQSSSYSRMVDNCIPVRKCSSDLTGWLNGEHPTFEDSIVRREVCFHGLLNCCYRTVQIRVRECQAYYVYELNPSPTERFSRYCASARTLSSALSTRQDSINGQHALVKKTVS